MKRQTAADRIINDAYTGSLLAHWALAIANFPLGIALLMLDLRETELVHAPVRGEIIAMTWPTFGFWLRACGAWLVVSSVTIPLLIWVLSVRELGALRATVSRNPGQLEGVLNYVGNVGLMATGFGIAAGVFSLTLLLVELLSRADSPLWRFQLSAAVWVGGVLAALGAALVAAFALWRHRQYGEVLRGEGRLLVTPLRRIWVLPLAVAAVALGAFILYSSIPALAGWSRE